MHPSDPGSQPFLGDPLPEPALGALEQWSAGECSARCSEASAETGCASAPDWRAEVASRVSDYRSRHPRRNQHPASASPGLDAAGEEMAPAGTEPGKPSGKPLEPSSYPVPAIIECPPPPPADTAGSTLEFASEFSLSELSPHALARLEELRQAAHGIFDTNFYRRRNLESLSAAAAERAAEATASAVDLDLHGPAPGNACLDRYYITEPAPPAEPLAPSEFENPGLPSPGDANDEEGEQGNLIFFPSPLLEPPLLQKPSRDELAEPVGARPRILEVPEDIIPALQGSLFPEIRLDGEEHEAAGLREPEIDAPLPVAPFLARLQASLVDSAAVAAAGALFAAMAWRALPGVPHTKPFWLAMAGVVLLLGAVYEYLFLLYAGRTLGMKLLRLQLATFEGERPDWRRRRQRTRFLLLSAVSGMLGNLWALLDKDMLCWHDRLSQTFLMQEPAAEPESE